MRGSAHCPERCIWSRRRLLWALLRESCRPASQPLSRKCYSLISLISSSQRMNKTIPLSGILINTVSFQGDCKAPKRSSHFSQLQEWSVVQPLSRGQLSAPHGLQRTGTVLHYSPESAQTRVHRVSDATQKFKRHGCEGQTE